MDYVQQLRGEASGSHAIYHQFALMQSKCALDTIFLFFEGDEDPAFYIGHLLPYLGDRRYHEFVCNGRDEVLNVYELCARDGRARGRVLYFIDKDHSDFIGSLAGMSNCTYQTKSYSFENYLVCEAVFRRYWVERLRLPNYDARYEVHVNLFHALYQSFVARMKLLTAIILLGRGIDGGKPIKLNLNNVRLERLLRLDFSTGSVHWLAGAGKHFIDASDCCESRMRISVEDIKKVCRKYLQSADPKGYIRGKYELWFFLKFLEFISRRLSDRKAARAAGMQRARPGELICSASCIDSLAPLAPCPPDLATFLALRLSPAREEEPQNPNASSNEHTPELVRHGVDGALT
jgi:hypothetical protein